MNMKKVLAHVVLAILLAFTDRASEAQTTGIWSSASELREKPMSGPAWWAVWKAANEDTSHPRVADQNDPTNVRVLAAAIVYGRTGDPAHREKVIDSVENVVQWGHPGGRTLAWARESGAYAMAADLVEYRTVAFETWLHRIADVWKGTDGSTLRMMFERRPNNWGAHAFGSLCAIYRYLDDKNSLREIRKNWIQGVIGPNPGYKYGNDLSWHFDSNKPRLINPRGAFKYGLNIDGFFPDDMRRGGSFRYPPRYTNYVWGVQQGLIMAARILERAGLPIWETDEQSLYRAANALQVRLAGEWKAKGDDLWMLPFYDDAYGTNWSRGQDVWGAGKNAGWAYVLVKTNLRKGKLEAYVEK